MKRWKTYTFKDLVKLSKEKYNPKKETLNLPCIELEHIESETGRLIGIINSNEQESIKNKFQPGDVLYGKLRPYLKKYYYAEFEGVCSSEIWVFQARKNVIENKFLYYLIQSNKFNSHANKSTGTKMPRADWNYISQVTFKIPPLNEQQKISTILTAWDKAIELKEKLIEQKKELKKGLMQKLLTGEVRLPGFEGKWKKTNLEKVATVIMGQSPPSKSYNETQKGIPLIQGNADCIDRKTSPTTWTTKPTKICQIGDIIMTVRAPVGVISRSLHEACIGRGVCAIRSKEFMDQDFLYYQLIFNEHRWGRFSQGSTFESINSNDIKSFKIDVPSLKEQRAISQVLLKADEELTLHKSELLRLKEQKKGLMQLLLTGKVRVKV